MDPENRLLEAVVLIISPVGETAEDIEDTQQ